MIDYKNCENCKKARFKMVDNKRVFFCTLGSYKAKVCVLNNYNNFEKGMVKIFYEHN